MANLEDSVSSVTVSSQYDATYAKEKAYDNNTATEWASANNGVNSWIQFNWAAPVVVREIYLVCRGGADSWGVPRFTFSSGLTTDGRPLAAGQSALYVMRLPVTTTSLRISIAGGILNSSANAGFKEVEIRDTYTSAPLATDVTQPDHLSASTFFDYSWHPWLAIDGNTATEWASLNEYQNAWIQWQWDNPVKVDSIWLRDRPANQGASWGVPRFTFADNSTQDGGEEVADSGTTYTLAISKVTTSLKISIASGGDGGNRGFAEVVLTGNVTAPTAVASCQAIIFM